MNFKQLLLQPVKATGRFGLIITMITGLLFSLSLHAHHSWSEFDSTKPVEITGTVSEVDWRSPHARLYVDFVNEDGETVNWNFELPSPNTLMRRGWTRKSLQPGDTVTVNAIRARNFDLIGIATTVYDGEGTAMFTGITETH